MDIRKRTRLVPLVVILLTIYTVAPELATAAPEGPVRVALLVSTDDLAGPLGEDVMIGVSRAAQEFGGTIAGREGSVSFGERLAFTVLATSSEKEEVTAEIRGFDLSEYDLVFGCGYIYRDPLIAVHREAPATHFVVIDIYGAITDGESNLTSLEFHMADTAFLAGAVAAAKVGGRPIGFIGALDMAFIRQEFLDGFALGIEYVDSLQGTDTELRVDFVGGFDLRQDGYDMAMAMYRSGVECIYQAAGGSGIGVMEAAGEVGKWSIGVDADQGLQFADRPFAEWILTSTVKHWGKGVYLVCAEYLTTGEVPSGTQVVGLTEGCTDIAINPYNTPHLLDQWELITSVRGALERGEVPSAAPSTGETVWKSRSLSAGEDKKSLSVNDPDYSAGIDTSHRLTLQKALSTAFHETGRYLVISGEQKGRLLEEISASLDVMSDEKRQLEAGRLIAAEIVVFVDLSVIGSTIVFDTKMVDVATGITVAALSRSFDRVETAFRALPEIVQILCNQIE